MKIKSIFLMVAVVAFIGAGCQQNGGGKVKLETSIDSTSYALGVLIGQNNKQSLENAPGGKEINIDILAESFRQFMKGDSTLLSAAESNQIVSEFFEKMYGKMSQDNLEAGNAYLEKNKSREGVVTTDSGLQYEVIKEGTGPKPTENDVVKVHYHGTLIDGTVFDSSVDRGEPAEFQVNRVIPGWVEALQLMPVGSKWKVYIPANLAYGERGTGGVIGPNAALIFEVELLEIVPQAKQ
ncbi:MAG TPA: FKBP-type peptidyl-prolyl cis-trans isomerase [Prolixibacteraceae bacterium]|nr:FKBP-type peptidyl-prolyl cis-trans isomerase [Prolixibacteraceae bacterium]